MGSFLSVAPAGVGDGAVSQSFTRCRVRSVVVPFEQAVAPGTKCCRAYGGRAGPRDGEDCPSHRPDRHPRTSVRGPSRGPPGHQLLAGGVLADRPLVEPHRRAGTCRPGRAPGPGGCPGPRRSRCRRARGGPPPAPPGPAARVDPRLEVVVGAGEPLGLARVAGGAVRAGQPVQPRQQRAGVGDVAAHGRVGPLRRRRSRGSAGAARPAGRPP